MLRSPQKRICPRSSSQIQQCSKAAFNASSALQQDESSVKTPPFKQPAVSSVSTNSAKPKKLQPWDATSCYQLVCTSRYQPVGASNYFLQIYYQLGPKCQIYATFKFGALEGMMRLCPLEALISRRNAWEEPMLLQEFDDACVLDKYQLPFPKSKGFLIRWRGKEGDAWWAGRLDNSSSKTIPLRLLILGAQRLSLQRYIKGASPFRGDKDRKCDC
jgi:hypothetical protein